VGRGWKKYPYNHLLFAQNLQTYRLALGWSFGYLASVTHINKGTLQQVEEAGRSLPEKQRRVVVDALLEALETNGTPYNREEFLKNAGLAETTATTTEKRATPQKRGALPAQLKFNHLMLEFAESRIIDLQRQLYSGKGQVVLTETEQWYHKIIDADVPNDPSIAAIQLKYGILLGQAQEAVLPWYQRRKIAIHTYTNLQERIISRFPLNQFPYDYGRMLVLRGRLYRELRQFEGSSADFEDGLFYARKLGDRLVEAALLREYAHMWAVQGNETSWKQLMEKAYTVASGNTQIARVVKSVEAEGYRRLAYTPLLSLEKRKDYATKAIECFKEAQDLYSSSGQTETYTININGHPLLRAVSRAQCFIWVQPEMVLAIAEEVRQRAEQYLPTLVARMDYTTYCAHHMLHRRKNDPLPVFNLDKGL
jgi:transcriptional regulator with XRE-family HTH domain